ncbi:MAG: Na(+)/H(+) antiporter subunit C [Rhodococcus sp. (in: high G+C Gram-positive bacteria)]|jgi:multicomponent Na+:H+ antiporter subunit C|uniref:Na(+)/H(+) antiporter subunit C n=1 Tax=Rhodococcus sp. EPR-157 TaxID=1813677 RepID=UPI0007BB5711|nr:Na(+)/H(+) antiporter subunit C [Rhodococcus sp. EPR-157]KZE99994.1 cation:proton antiporter [Rhodococcus sp. EPR-157]
MTANLGMLIVAGALAACGVYLLLERSITKMLLGLLLFGNGVNILLLTVGGPPGNPPIVGRNTSIHETMADPLAQGVILTAIVITMGIAAFVLALAYRSYTLNTRDDVENDPEDTKVSKRRSMAEAPDRDRSDDPVTGEPSFGGDAFDSRGNPIPIEELKNIEDLECYEDLHEGDFDDDDDEPEMRGLDGIDSALKDTSAVTDNTGSKGDEK